jgi:hypothetical protein
MVPINHEKSKAGAIDRIKYSAANDGETGAGAAAGSVGDVLRRCAA